MIDIKRLPPVQAKWDWYGTHKDMFYAVRVTEYLSAEVYVGIPPSSRFYNLGVEGIPFEGMDVPAHAEMYYEAFSQDHSLLWVMFSYDPDDSSSIVREAEEFIDQLIRLEDKK